MWFAPPPLAVSVLFKSVFMLQGEMLPGYGLMCSVSLPMGEIDYMALVHGFLVLFFVSNDPEDP